MHGKEREREIEKCVENVQIGDGKMSIEKKKTTTELDLQQNLTYI